MKRHRLALWGFFGFAVLCSIVLFGLYCSQRTLIYAPKKYTADEESAILNRLGLDPNCQIDLISADKTRIRAYWIPSINPNKAPTVLYLHGNTGKIEWGLNAGLEWRRSIGVNSLVISYRGFGCSGGSPNMDGIRKDSQVIR